MARAEPSGLARLYQAGRDQHIHYHEGLTVRSTLDAQPDICPYPGLAAFGSQQAEWFFGRDRFVADLIHRLDERLATGGMQLVVAPSGAGKSSLLRAGLLPTLEHGALPGSHGWQQIFITPTSHPMRALEALLTSLIGDDAGFVARNLTGDPRGPLGRLRQALTRNAGGDDVIGRVVLVVDQFEEVFSLCEDDRERREFIDFLAQVSAPDRDSGAPPVGLTVVGLRSDFYTACLDYPQLLAALQDGPMVVGPMSANELRQAIVFPAQAVGMALEPGLVELLLHEVGITGATSADEEPATGYETGRLPLLAYALRAIWQQRRGHTLTVAGYRETGGIHRAIATTAERIFASLDRAGQDMACALFLRLVKIESGGVESIRRRRSRTQLTAMVGDPSAADAVIEAFVGARLLTLTQDTVEITHDALLLAWPRLRDWIDRDRANLLFRQELEDAAAGWDQSGRESDFLYRGARLTNAIAATSTFHEATISATASEFLAASAKLLRRLTRVRQSIVAGFVVLVMLTSAVAFFAIQQLRASETQARDAIYARIVAQNELLRGADSSLAAQLDLAAYQALPGNQTAYTNLISAANNPLARTFGGHTGAVTSVAFSPDGRTLATASDDHTVLLWNITDSAAPAPFGQPLTADLNPIDAVAFSPDGHLLATADRDGIVLLWNVTDPAHPTVVSRLEGQKGGIQSVMFSPNGQLLATVSDDVVRLWHIADPVHPAAVGGTLKIGGATTYVAFSPDGRVLATAAGDGSVRLWNVDDPAHAVQLGPSVTAAAGSVNGVAFSPDGHVLATAAGDGSVRLWNVDDPAHAVQLGRPLTGATGAINSVAFSPDGRTLASASDDHTVRLWSIPATVLLDQPGPVKAVAFSPDGRTLASASDGHTVRLWDVSDPGHPAALGELPTVDLNSVDAVAFSPNGKVLSLVGAGLVRLWDVSDPANPVALGRPRPIGVGSVDSVAFSPSGRTLATVAGGLVRLWDVSDPANPVALGGPPSQVDAAAVDAVAFSPDGKVLAVAGDGSVVLWNITRIAQPVALGRLAGPVGVPSVVFSPDGRTLATAGGGGSARLWNITDPAHPAAFSAPQAGPANAVAFSPDGQTLATARADGSVRLWNVTDPAHPTAEGDSLDGHTAPVNAIAFGHNGKTLASASDDDTIRLWQLDVAQAVQRICANTTSPTQNQWDTYVGGGVPYAPPCR
jgi:WD40 repeat protein